MNIMKNEWFPFVTKSVKSKHGWDMFYYGNTQNRRASARAAARPWPGEPAPARRAAARPTPPPPPPPPPPRRRRRPRSWGTFEHVPRFHNNYVGLRNRFALLSEAYSYATFEDRIKVTNYFMEEALNFAHQNVDTLKKAIAGRRPGADRRQDAGDPRARSRPAA